MARAKSAPIVAAPASRLLSALLALTLGSLGGALFAWLGVPLAWMLGSLSANGVAAIAGLPAALPPSLRGVTLAVLGTFLGSTFTLELFERVGTWPWSIAATLLVVALLVAVSVCYYRLAAGFDRLTALFSSTPGGLSAMVALGGASGGDPRRIALTQTLRVVIVVFAIPALVASNAALPPEPVTVTDPAAGMALQPWLQWPLLAAGVAGAVLLTRRLRLPAAELIGALAASAALHVTGLVTLPLPTPLVLAALCVLGASIGCTFRGFRVRELLQVGRHALVVVAVMLALIALAARLISDALQLDYLAVLLALAPGGIAEMSLIAIAFDIDPLFVTTHHLARVVIILTAAPIAASWLARSTPGSGRTPLSTPSSTRSSTRSCTPATDTMATAADPVSRIPRPAGRHSEPDTDDQN